MLKRLLVAALVSTFVFVGGCKQKDKLVGAWRGDLSLGIGTQDLTLSGNVNFNEDGTFSADVRPSQFVAILTWSGKWVREENTLSLTPSAANIDLSKAPVVGAILGEGRARAEAELMKPRSGTLEWRGDNEVVFTPPGGPVITLRRDKAEG